MQRKGKKKKKKTVQTSACSKANFWGETVLKVLFKMEIQQFPQVGNFGSRKKIRD